MDRSMLARATEGTEAPTPGYLYVDLAKAAGRHPSACQEMALYLTRRLSSKNNPNIKYKCCKVIAKLCEQVPRNQFRRVLAQDPQSVGAIKEAMAFRGTLDPVQGDTKNERVRQAAKEALDQVYSETTTMEASYNSNSSSNSASAFGSHQNYGASPHSAAGPSRMQGIGNPRYNDPRLEQANGSRPTSIKDAVKEAGEVVLGMIKDPLARQVDQAVAAHSQHSTYNPNMRSAELPGYNRGGQSNSMYGRPPPGQAELARQTNGEWTMASNRGPQSMQPSGDYAKQMSPPTSGQASWGGTNNASTGVHSSGVGGSWGQAAVSQPAIPSVYSQSSQQYSTSTSDNNNATSTYHKPVSDGSYEKALIQELCPPGGLKPVPPPDKLAAFARSVGTLDSELVCPTLLDCLEDGQPWMMRAKALHVMLVCIQSSNPAYRDFFIACQDEVVPLASHPRLAIAQPAKQVLHILGLSDAASAPSSGVAAGQQQQRTTSAPAPNLLDFDDAPAAPSQPSTSDSLFGGMQVKSKSVGAATAAAAATVASPAPASGNLLDFMGDNTATTDANAANTNTDVFASVQSIDATDNSVTAVNGANTSSAESMFANMSIKQEADVKPAEAPVNDGLTSLAGGGGAGGSAFGFLNQPAASNEGLAPQQPQKNVFDPLMNGNGSNAGNGVMSQMAGQPSPNTQMKMMQLSPEQMQAMAYQQMLMQQRQMAMMQQQRMYLQPQAGAAVGMQMQQPRGSSFTMAVPKKQDKQFDFVKDAMKFETKK